MSAPDGIDVASAGAAKAPPPDLAMRAPRPKAVRLRGSVVKAILMSGVVVVSGALAWAFIVQPELRASARGRAVGTGEAAAPRAVRPAEIVTEQPATYDRLPPPRSTSPEARPDAAPEAATRRPGPVRERPRPLAQGPTAATLARRSSLFFPAPPQTPARPTPAGTVAQVARSGSTSGYNPHRLTPPVSPFELKAGALIPAVLLTAVDTARPGPVIAAVVQNVFDSVSGRHLVLPQGARLVGASGGDNVHGDARAYITWERLILPNGKSLLLDGAEGVDAQGAAGVRGRVDRRLIPLGVGTAFAGAVTAVGQAARDEERGGGLLGDAGDAAAIEAARVGGRLVERELEVRPSIRLAAGTPVGAMVTRDLVLEPYQP